MACAAVASRLHVQWSRDSTPTSRGFALRPGANSQGHLAAVRCDNTACSGPIAKEFLEEPTWDELRAALMTLPLDERRAALSIIGLAIGDAAGLPFELRRGARNRAQFHALKSDLARYDLAKGLVSKRALRKEHSPFVRTYSDDTACCDLKMEAAAQAERVQGKSAEEALRLAVLQQYLKWAHGAKDKDGIGKHGELFQGTGGFTQDFLIPYIFGRKNEVARELGVKPLFETHPVMGEFWPTEEFANFALHYFQGDYSFPSWGNGAVMSFAPHPVLAGRWRRRASAAHPELQAAAIVMSRSHQEPTAWLGAEVMWELLDAVYSGAVGTTSNLRRVVAGLPKVLELSALEHECIPVGAFREWLEKGDCQVATAEAFLCELGMDGPFALASGPHGVFGAMLHVAADWNDDHKTRLKRPCSKEVVLFSQRGLNSLIIAIWAASDVTSPWQAISRVLYVGGDTDTVGAVVGQVACPLLDPSEVVNTFIDFTALGPTPMESKLQLANAAARRYFRRALLFAAGDLQGLRKCPSLTDVNYPPFTKAVVKEMVLEGLDVL